MKPKRIMFEPIVFIRLTLSLTTILYLLSIGKAKIVVARLFSYHRCLPEIRLIRPQHMHETSKGMDEIIDEFWKLIKPACGLVEAGILWQLCIEEWLHDYGFDTIPGLA